MQLIGAHRHISHLMLLALVTTMMHVMASAQRAELVLSPARTRKLTSEQHRGHVFMERAGTFTLGRYRYIVRYCACVDKAHAPYVAPLEGYIGMPEPSRANWYHSGFLFIRINGEDIGTTPLSSMLAVESGKRAMLDMTWHHKLADVRVRFVGLPNDDKMLVEITVERKAKITSIEVFARCYPSFFTAWYKRTGARRILTPTSLIKQGERVTLPAKQNWWLVYYDEVFDVARGEGDGPCAMLFIPEDAIDITLNCGSYAVDTTVRFRPTARRLLLAFWDFKGRSNESILKAMPQMAQRTRQQLIALDFTPTVVRTFNFASARRDIERAKRSEYLRRELGDELKRMETWLNASAPLFEKQRVHAPATVAVMEQFLKGIDAYNRFRWKLKLLELLEF